MIEIGSIQEVELREVWPDEARDFTPWLAENPEYLSEVLGLDLELERKEMPVGPFSADVVLRESSTGHRVVVENLLEPTDHGHVGQLITYAAGLDAAYGVLVAKRFRPEHKSALNWLNSLSGEGTGFFGVEVKAIRIGSSAPAPLLEVVVEPDDWARQAQTTAKGQQSETQARYVRWWGEFLPVFHQNFPGWSNASKPGTQNWMNFPSGKSGVRYDISFAYPTTNYCLRAGLYLDNGAEHYEALLAQRTEIDALVPAKLHWEPLENSRASRICAYLDPADPADEERWDEYRAWLVMVMDNLRDAVQERLLQLP